MQLRLVEIRAKHYSPKDSHDGLATWAVVPGINDEAVLDWLVKASRNVLADGCYWDLSDWDDDGLSEVEVPVDLLPSTEVARATAMGLSISDIEEGWDYRTLSGEHKQLILFMRGDTWEEVGDLYYGATQWYWEWGGEVSQLDAQTLVNLGVAIRLEGE